METNCISHKQRSFCTGKYLVGWAYNSLEHAIACLVVEPDRQVCPDCFKVALEKRYAGEIPTEPVFAPHMMNALRGKPTVPAWVLGWRGSGDTGVSSKAICYHMLKNPDLLALHRSNDRMDAPYDCWDLGRCVRLLDLAHDKG
ncbi:MAG: hypothetical protein EBU84_21460, partial [Actinobacteria bacterium]|nr:hypothetical protein [Actinomycetota bacterium]